MRNIIIIFIVFVQYGCASDSYYYQNSKKIGLSSVKSISRSNSKIDYYQNERGTVMGVTNHLIVKFKNIKNLNHYLSEFNLAIEKILGKNLYLLKTINKSLTINISNRLSEKADIEYSQPDFIKKRVRR